MMKSFYFKGFILIFVFGTISCKTRDLNYVTYYQKVFEIDSIYRFAKKPEIAAKEYKKLFREYEPKNQPRLGEYETYIALADQYNIDFGGKKSLRKLIHLLAPYKKVNLHRNYELFTKYGMDSVEVELEFSRWKKNINKELLDSFSIAAKRDLLSHKFEKDNDINNEKNLNLFLWSYKNHGFPSIQKIGIDGNDDTHIFMSMLLKGIGQNTTNEEEFEDFKRETWKYVQTGDCLPEDFAIMVDAHEIIVRKKSTTYGKFTGSTEVDTVQANKNRKKIGLPSLKHGTQIGLDFIRKNKNE